MDTNIRYCLAGSSVKWTPSLPSPGRLKHFRCTPYGEDTSYNRGAKGWMEPKDVPKDGGKDGAKDGAKDYPRDHEHRHH